MSPRKARPGISRAACIPLTPKPRNKKPLSAPTLKKSGSTRPFPYRCSVSGLAGFWVRAPEPPASYRKSATKSIACMGSLPKPSTPSILWGMNTPSAHKRRRHRRGTKGASSKPQQGRGKAQGRSTRPRHYYDVRQYALLQDSSGNLLILQLPKEYDEAAANTWTLPGGKLEPADEPGAGLLREIAEETGLEPDLKGLAAIARWSNRNSKKLAIFYHAAVAGTKPALKLSGEHQRAIWISPTEAPEFPFHRPDMLTVIQTHLK